MKRELIDVPTAQMPNATENESLHNDEDGGPSTKKPRIDEKEEEEDEPFKTEINLVVEPVVQETNAVVTAGSTVPPEVEAVLPGVGEANPQGAVLPVTEAAETEAGKVLPVGTDNPTNAAKSETVDVESTVDEPKDDLPDEEAAGLDDVETPKEEPNHVGTPSDMVVDVIAPKEDPSLECKVEPLVADETKVTSEIYFKEESVQKDEVEMPKEETKQEDEVDIPKEETTEQNADEMPVEETKEEDNDEMPEEETKQEDNEEKPTKEGTRQGEEDEGQLFDEAKEDDKKNTHDVAQEGENVDGDDSQKGSKGRRLTFPEKLMELLNSEEYQESMCWLPNGNAFALHPPKFLKEILPKHFEGTKFESFTRKLNRWGFKRIAGEDAPEETFAYSHHLFKRDYAELCRGMSGGKKMEQDFSHLIRYRERERLINAAASNPVPQGSLSFGSMPGAPDLGMQAGLGQQFDLQRMLLERQIAATGGMGLNLYGNFGGGGGFERDLAIREMLLRQEATTGQNTNAALFQQQQFARFGQAAGSGHMQMNQMQMAQLAQMGQGGQMMINQAGQGPASFEASMMAGGTGTGNANAMSIQQQQQLQQQQQQNHADLKMMQEQRFRIQQQMAMQNAASGMNPAFNAGSGGGGRTFGI